MISRKTDALFARYICEFPLHFDTTNMKTFLSIILVCVATFWSLGSHAYTFSDLRDPLAAYFDARFEEALTAENIIPENVVYYQKEYDQKRASFLNLIDTYITTNTSVKRGFPKFAESLRNIMQYIDTFALQESEFVITQKSISTLAQAEVMEVQQVFVDTLRQYMYTLASDMHETGELQFEVHTKGFDLSVQSQLLDTYVSQDGNKARADIMLDIALDVRSEDGSKVRLDAIVGFEVISSFDEQYIYWHTFTYDVSGDDSLLPFSGEDTLEKADYFFDRYNDVFLRVTGEQDTFASPVVAPSALQTVLDIIYEQPLFVLDVATVGDEVLYLEPNAPTWNAIGDALGYDSVLFDLATVVSDVLHLEATLDLFDDGSVMDIQMKNTDIYGNLVIGNREVFMLDLFIQDIVAPDDENVTIHWEEGVFFLDFINDF